MVRFFFPEPMSLNGSIQLSLGESHHLVHVLRLKPGSVVQLFDGKGKLATGTVQTAHPKRSEINISEIKETPLDSKVHLVFGTVKPVALEFVLRRVTEVGVRSFQPILTQHSFRVKGWNQARYEKMLIEVCKQCEENHLPILKEPIDFETWMKTRDSVRTIVICDEGDRSAQLTALQSQSELDLLIGSEGGWSDSERDSLKMLGANSMGLGRHRLRMETAALVATALINHQFSV